MSILDGSHDHLPYCELTNRQPLIELYKQLQANGLTLTLRSFVALNFVKFKNKQRQQLSCPVSNELLKLLWEFLYETSLVQKPEIATVYVVLKIGSHE